MTSISNVFKVLFSWSKHRDWPQTSRHCNSNLGLKTRFGVLDKKPVIIRVILIRHNEYRPLLHSACNTVRRTANIHYTLIIKVSVYIINNISHHGLIRRL